MMSDYSQLILFDCEGGRANLFHDKSVLNQLPSNCECCLFWNQNNQAVTGKVNQLRNIPQIYLCPSNLCDSNNSAVSKLIYILGKFAYDYDFIFIVHGDDNIYSEAIESVIEDYGQDKIDQKKIRCPTNKALLELFVELRKRNEQHKYVDPKLSNMLPKNLSVSELVNISEKSCPKCSKRFTNIPSLCDHVTAKHNQNAIFICACSFKCSSLSDFNRHLREKKRQIIDSQGIVCCPDSDEPAKVYITPHSAPLILLSGKMNPCIFKCSRLWFEPAELFHHFEAVHGNEIDIRVKCCSPKIKYTLDQFRDHIGSQHNLIDIQ
jgi:hypothetical protein